MKKRLVLIGLLSLVLTSCSVMQPVSQNNQRSDRAPELEQTANLASEEQQEAPEEAQSETAVTPETQQEKASPEQQTEKKQEDQTTSKETVNIPALSKGTSQEDAEQKNCSEYTWALNRRSLFFEYLANVELGQRHLGLFQCGFFQKPFDWGIEQYTAGSGILSVAMRDFDLDGEEEMAVIWVGQDGIPGTVEYTHHVYMLVYDIVNGRVCITDQEEIASGIVFSGSDRRTDFFLVDLYGKMHLCVESYSIGGFIGDGADWMFSAYAVQNGQIYTSFSENLSAESFEAREGYETINRLRFLGFQNPYLLEGEYLPHFRFVDNEPGVTKLATFEIEAAYLTMGEYGYDLYNQHKMEDRGEYLPILVSFNDYSDMSVYLNLPRRDGF